MSYPDTAQPLLDFSRPAEGSWKRDEWLQQSRVGWLCVCVYISFVWLVGLLVAFDTLPRREETEKKKKKLILRPDWIQPQLKRTTQEGRAFLFPTGDQNGGDGARYNIQTHTHTERELYGCCCYCSPCGLSLIFLEGWRRKFQNKKYPTRWLL